MRTIKRIVAVVILCVLVLFVSYSCYTGGKATEESPTPAFIERWQDG